MRFPERLRAVALCALLPAATTCFASAEAARQEVAARLQQQLPGLPVSSYAQGAAAFDDDLRAQAAAPAPGAAAVLDAGRKLWERKFRNGRSLATCFPNGGRRVAAAYPQYDTRVKSVITLEMAINQCLKTHKEPLLEHGDPATMGAVTAYLRSLSNGQKLAVRVPAVAEPRFQDGRRLYFTRMGQRNYACASCHVQGAGKRFGDTPLSPAIGQATHWPVIREGVPVTLHMRIRECLDLMGAAPFAAGSDELNHLEYFLSYLSNGLPLRANVARPKPP
jgi:L-cysteine S-thiosulfotransferase